MSEEKENASVCDHLGNAGPLPEIHWNDRVFKVAYPTRKTLATLEIYLAVTGVEEAKLIGKEAEALQAIMAREHRALGPIWNRTFATIQGKVLLFWACVKDNHKDFTVADAAKMFREKRTEVSTALALVEPDFLALVATVGPLTVAELQASPAD